MSDLPDSPDDKPQSGELEPLLWKVFSDSGWRYYEPDEYPSMVAAMTEAALLHDYLTANNSYVWPKRSRIRSWLLRGTEHSLDAEHEAGLMKRSVPEPRLYALVGSEWVDVAWILIEPTVGVALSGSSAPATDDEAKGVVPHA